MYEIILKARYFERDYQKALKKVTFFFQAQSLSIDKIIKNKKGLDQWLFRLPNKFRKIPLLVMYYLTKFDDVI